MAKVQVNASKLNARPVMPAAIYMAEIINCEYPFQAPWDSEDFGVNFEFQIIEEGPYKGRRVSLYATTTEGKNFSGRYAETMISLGKEPNDEWETEEMMGRKVAIRINQYTNKTGVTRNGVEEVFPTAS